MMRVLNEHVGNLLDKIRTHMEAAWGPEAVDNPPNTAGENAEPGDLEASNPTDAADAFNMYLITIIDRLVQEFGMSDDDAMDFVFDAADELYDTGDLPEIPEEDEAQALSLWMGKAKSFGFVGYVLRAAREDS